MWNPNFLLNVDLLTILSGNNNDQQGERLERWGDLRKIVLASFNLNFFLTG